MIIVARPFGDHSNRLFQSIHFEAYCLEHGRSFINPTLTDIHRTYGRPRLETILSGLLLRAVRVARRLSIIRPIAYDTPEQVDTSDSGIAGRRCVFVQGWGFRQQALVRKHRARLASRNVATGTAVATNRMLNLIAGWSASGATVVGVHVRRGDYATFEDGRYLYSHDQYRQMMARMRELLREQECRDIRFVVFSNDPLPFPVESDGVRSTEAWWIDHLAMSRCDYLLGPPSTFSLWASFIGGVRYRHIVRADEAFTLDQFVEHEG